jgi:PKD repeat protein
VARVGRIRGWSGVLATLAAGLVLGGCFDTDEAFVTQIRADPNPAEPDQTVTFDARKRPGEDAIASEAKVGWDLDGNGTYETLTGTGNPALFATTTFPAPGTYSVGLDVGYPAGFIPGILFATAGIQVFLHEYVTQNVTVVAPVQPQPGNQPPTASFRHDADPGHEETPVRFDATGSTDPDGGPLTYEWDFGDKHSDDDAVTTKRPSTSYTYDSPGEYIARLRVFDGTGLAAETTRMVQVVAGKPPSPDDAPRAAGSGRGSSPFALTVEPSAMTDEGTPSATNGSLLRTGVVVRGRLTLRQRLARPLDRTRTPRWTARFMVKQRGRMGAANLAVEGQMLVDFGGGDRVCTATRVTARRGDAGAGLLAVIGGTGAGTRVGGQGTFGVSLTDEMGVTGRLRLTRHAARPLPPECRTLLRLSRRTR